MPPHFVEDRPELKTPFSQLVGNLDGSAQKVKNTLNATSHEKFHRRNSKGARNISDSFKTTG